VFDTINGGLAAMVLISVLPVGLLQTWAAVDIDENNHDFTAPLVRHAEELERGYGATTRFVLLGSVASSQYVRPLTRVFGDHLLFPPSFVGRGDMSRGAILLRAARDGVELDYAPVEGAIRRGPRTPRLEARSTRRSGNPPSPD